MQLLITTSLKICYIRDTKQNIFWSWWRSCTTAALEASSRASRSYRRSVWIHRRFRPFSSFASISRVCWTNVACSVVDVCVKLQVQSVITSHEHCTETTSSAIEFRCNWTSVFHLWPCAKQTTKSARYGKDSKTCDMLQTAAWNCWTGLASEMNTEHCTRTDCEIFRHYFLICSWVSLCQLSIK